VPKRSYEPLRRLAELLALTAFAIAQPVLDVTGRAPDFFLYRRANTNEMRLFLALVVLGPPLGLWLVELAVGLVSRKAVRFLHMAFAGMLFASVLVQIGKDAGLFTGIPLGVVAIVAGAVLGVVLANTPRFRQVVQYATPAPLVFALLFAMTSPAGALVRGVDLDRGEKAVVLANRPPIVFLFLDEFPLRVLLDEDGAIDEKLYPNFARLQKVSNWYPNATGVTGWTPFAVPAMLRGRFPEKANAASYINYQETLFTLVGGTYDMRAYETISELCPPGMCLGVAAGRKTGMRALGRDTIDLTTEIVSPYPPRKNVTDQFVENAVAVARQQAEGQPVPGAQDKFDEVGKNQPERLAPFLADLQPMARPNLHFMHFLLPHAPYRYLPSGLSYQRLPRDWPPERPDPTKPDKTTPSDPLFEMLTKQQLVLQTMYLDDVLGTMLDRMEATGLLDQALLIVTADHGTGIDPRVKYRQLDEHNAPDLAWVPLFVKTPGQQDGKVDRRNAQHVDLLPTIADVLDVEIPWEVDGISLLGAARTDTQKTWYDVPGVKETIDPPKWADVVTKGYAHEVMHPERGRRGLFAIGDHADLVGKKVSELTVGAPSAVRARLHQTLDLSDADPAGGFVPAAVFGELSEPLGDNPVWLVASVNGTIAGGVAAMPSDGTWRYAGVLDDSLFEKGRPDVALYEVRGTTLHRIAFTTP
jgi:hypothetical protein